MFIGVCDGMYIMVYVVVVAIYVCTEPVRAVCRGVIRKVVAPPPLGQELGFPCSSGYSSCL